MNFMDSIRDQTKRSLWSLHNVIKCIPDSDWSKDYCGMPLWKHIYHTLHSLDRWYINPFVYEEPPFHKENMNNLDALSEGFLSKEDILRYFEDVERKILLYIDSLTDNTLSEEPENCSYTRFRLILAQHRHLDMHIGMLMGFMIADKGLWPRVMGLESAFTNEEQGLFFS